MISDFVYQTTNSPGTSASINLIAPPTGRVSFASKFSSGAAVFYFLDDGSQYEAGYATLTTGSPDVLSRDTVVSNSAGTTARLNFAGLTRVYNDVPASSVIYRDKFGQVTISQPNTSGIALNVSSTSNTSGANIALLGNGATAPNKYIRSIGGVLQVVNSAYTTAILSLTDAGALTVAGATALSSTLNVAAATTLSSTLNVAAATTLSTTLNVTGNSGFTGLAGFSNSVSINTNSTGSPLALLQFAGGSVGSISTNGSSVAYNTTSDARLKQVFGSGDGGFIDAIPIHDAAFKTCLDDRYPMILAHELQAVAPWSVTGDNDAVDESGKIIPQQVDLTKLIPAMIAKMQAQSAEITELRARLSP